MNHKTVPRGLMQNISSAAHSLKKRRVTITVALLGLALILVVMTMNILKYETHLTTGKTVLLVLVPIDPRGFMQGDYMTLSYALEAEIFDAMRPAHRPSTQNTSDLAANESDSEFRIYEPSDGYVIVSIDSNRVGHFVRLADNHDHIQLAADEIAIHYRARNGSIKVATNAFFFQEGHAEAFGAAEYGLFRVNDQGEPLLTDLVNEAFEVINPKPISKAKVNNS